MSVAAASNELFSTVPKTDILGLGNDHKNLKNVVDFLDFQKSDVSKATGQAKNSIRYDERMPRELEERLLEIANIINLVGDYFNGDIGKASLWFKTSNPLLGNLSPRDMIRFGRYKKLHKFVMNAITGNTP